jgi:hypothetical protein
VDGISVLEEIEARLLKGGAQANDSGDGSSALAVVVQAKRLWEDDKEGAFDLVVTAAEDCHASFASLLPLVRTLRRHIEATGKYMEEQDQRIASLEKQGARLDKQVAQLVRERDHAVESKSLAQQKILLGQVAYTMAGMVEHYVYGPDGSGSLVPLRMEDLASKAEHLAGTQRARWVAIVKEISKIMPFEELVEADRYLRWLRNAPAHGSLQQIKDTRAVDLRDWAQRHCQVRAVGPVQRYVQVLSRFSVGERPLQANVARAKQLLVP